MINVLIIPMKQLSQLRKDMGMVSSTVKMSCGVKRSREKQSVPQREEETQRLHTYRIPMHPYFNTVQKN